VLVGFRGFGVDVVDVDDASGTEPRESARHVSTNGDGERRAAREDAVGTADRRVRRRAGRRGSDFDGVGGAGCARD